jgi:hypothetical protein
MIKRSIIITAFFDILRTTLNIKIYLCHDVQTPWSSTFCIIDSFLALREAIERLFDETHDLPLVSILLILRKNVTGLNKISLRCV